MWYVQPKEGSLEVQEELKVLRMITLVLHILHKSLADDILNHAHDLECIAT
jgi:hypothetical protein